METDEKDIWGFQTVYPSLNYRNLRENWSPDVHRNDESKYRRRPSIWDSYLLSVLETRRLWAEGSVDGVSTFWSGEVSYTGPPTTSEWVQTREYRWDVLPGQLRPLVGVRLLRWLLVGPFRPWVRVVVQHLLVFHQLQHLAKGRLSSVGFRGGKLESHLVPTIRPSETSGGLGPSLGCPGPSFETLEHGISPRLTGVECRDHTPYRVHVTPPVTRVTSYIQSPLSVTKYARNLKLRRTYYSLKCPDVDPVTNTVSHPEGVTDNVLPG